MTRERNPVLKGLLRIRRYNQQETPYALQEVELLSWLQFGEAYSALRGWRPIPAALLSHSVLLCSGTEDISLPTKRLQTTWSRPTQGKCFPDKHRSIGKKSRPVKSFDTSQWKTLPKPGLSALSCPRDGLPCYPSNRRHSTTPCPSRTSLPIAFPPDLSGNSRDRPVSRVNLNLLIYWKLLAEQWWRYAHFTLVAIRAFSPSGRLCLSPGDANNLVHDRPPYPCRLEVLRSPTRSRGPDNLSLRSSASPALSLALIPLS